MSVINIFCKNKQFYDRARRLSKKLNSVDVVTELPPNESTPVYFLQVNENGVSLIHHGLSSHGPIRVDFVNGRVDYRRRYGGGAGQALAKAVGISKAFRPHVLDLTAGLGTDGYILASLGCSVHLVERNPIISCLLEDGINRAFESAIHDNALRDRVQKLKLIEGESRQILSGLGEDERADVIYLDPMFPSRNKTAMVKKEMQAFRSIVGDDSDSAALLFDASEVARYRVVVKRPSHSKFLGDQTPTFSLKGKSTRFDIYANKAIPK
jgi:16S rRNA (guanine1516-N2)-methyltransferase